MVHPSTPMQVYTWILELSNPDTREHALIELSKKREVLPDLAPMLWYSFGTLSALLQEIVMIYPVINPPSLTVRPCMYTLSYTCSTCTLYLICLPLTYFVIFTNFLKLCPLHLIRSYCVSGFSTVSLWQPF